ncbi:MAG TPA: hypothetical protein VFK76_09920 [Gaiellaceae bacterium]|nr:hypothetical protein [Gaiellaceae bacterium]
MTRGCAVAVAALAAVVVSLAVRPSSAASASPPNAATLTVTATSPGLSAPPTTPAPARLTEKAATRIALADPKVAAWLDRYPPDPATSAEFQRDSRTWVVKAWSGAAGQVALVTVEDLTGQVTEAWTGPQVAWKMARGGEAAFGGKTLDRVSVWLALCIVFLVGLADVRKPLSLRNLDLLVLLSFSVSLGFFNRGEIFTSVPLAYPPLVYLVARTAWAGFRGRGPALRPVWPAWVLAAAAVFLVGFRVGLNHESPHGVIDVGYAGVIGANRIVNGEAPYGHMPVRDDLEKCGPADAEGDVADRVQANGRCETANETGDTYGPVSYLMYVPAYLVFGWSGKWDSLPAGHATSIAFDLLTMLGLVLVGFRFGGARLASALAFAWAAYPFTAYALNANTNDSIMPAFLVFGFWLVSSPWARGGAVALAGWAKFGALLVAPLWATYPAARTRDLVRYAIAFVLATIAAFLVLLLEPSLWSAIETFWHRTIRSQITRESPFSIWGWGQYHARGIPDLGFLQPVVEALVVVLALAAAVVPRRKGPVELAALTAAVLVAFQIALTHWFYLYLPWVLPFLALWLLLPREEQEAEPTGEELAPV